MKELRDIKLDLLMGNKNPIVDLFNEITSGIKIINCYVYNEEGLEFIYHKDGQWIFYQDSKNEKFWVHYYKYWSIFESNFGLKYEEIQAITKYLVEEALKREVGAPFIVFQVPPLLVEEALKREVGTPISRNGKTPERVEEALKREIGTPNPNHYIISEVEEALKREVTTPFSIPPYQKHKVEEALKREIDKE